MLAIEAALDVSVVQFQFAGPGLFAGSVFGWLEVPSELVVLRLFELPNVGANTWFAASQFQLLMPGNAA